MKDSLTYTFSVEEFKAVMTALAGQRARLQTVADEATGDDDRSMILGRTGLVDALYQGMSDFYYRYRCTL